MIVNSFQTALAQTNEVLSNFLTNTISKLPLFLLAILIVVICLGVTRYLAKYLQRGLSKRLKSQMLAEMLTKILWIPAIILSFFIAFKIAGFSSLAFSFLGGSGVLGLILGFAFKDIGENFLASLLIGLQRPFKPGDIVSIGEVTGVVDRVTSRGTILMSFDGNHIQIPNTIVYKSIIHNLTTNPKIRFDFEVGIGFDTDINHAISVAKQVVCSQDEVIKDPEALFLIEKLGSATISLRIYFWINGQRLSGLKMKSKLMRKVKEAFESNGISMPDEAREIVFPQGVPIHQLNRQEFDETKPDGKKKQSKASNKNDDEDVSSDAEMIKKQLAESRPPEDTETFI